MQFNFEWQKVDLCPVADHKSNSNTIRIWKCAFLKSMCCCIDRIGVRERKLSSIECIRFDIGIIVSLWCIFFCSLLFFDRSTSRNLLGITNLFNLAYCLARANRHTGTNGIFDRMLKTLTNCSTFSKNVDKKIVGFKWTNHEQSWQYAFSYQFI